MSALAENIYSIGFPDTSGAGLGLEQAGIKKRLEAILIEDRISVWLDRNNKLRNTLEELNQVYKECSTPNWDGYESNPITNDTYIEASYIIELLAENYSNLPFPEIIPEPDGHIGLEWNDNYGQSFTFSIDANSIDANKRIKYAGIFGENKVHGTEIYSNDIPPAIIFYLKRLTT